MKRRPLLPCLTYALLATAGTARADIFQWEYINPADPGQGKQHSTMLTPGGSGVNAVPGADLHSRNLTMAYLIGANLTNAYCDYANLTNADLSQANLTNVGIRFTTLTGANLTGADVRGAFFLRDSFNGGTGLTVAQLSSTASYQAHDLTGIKLSYNNLAGVNLAGQNLTNAWLDSANLNNANFALANLTSATLGGANLTNANFSQADLRNAALGNATLNGAHLTGAEVRVRTSTYVLGFPVAPP